MATNTNNYGFKKPEENDFYSIEDQNRNWDLADTKMAQLNSDLVNLSGNMAGTLTSNILQIPALHTVCHMRWNADTLNTPYKDGIAEATLGFAIGFATSPSFGMLIAFAAGSADIYTRALSSGSWSAWTRK